MATDVQVSETSGVDNALRRRLLIAGEIILVLGPLYAALVVNERVGSDHTNLFGDVVLLQGPLAYAGLVVSLVALWLVSRRRGVGWEAFGLGRPKSWMRTIVMALFVALGVLGVVVGVINPAIAALGLDPRDMSMYEYLSGNLPTLLVNILLMWVTAGLVEELMWRGYLVNRIVDLRGASTRSSWLLAIVLAAIVFGLAHSFQGTMGMVKTGAIGLVFGVAYLALGRRLWPLVIAHALIDTIDFVEHFSG